MNDQLFSAAYHELCAQLRAIRNAGEWKLTHSSFDEYVRDRWSISKTRAKQLIHFAKLLELCRKESMPLPETPDAVAPLLVLAQKCWLDAWGMVCQYRSKAKPLNAVECDSILEHWGFIKRRKESNRAMAAKRFRRAADTLASIDDGAEAARIVGKNGFGKNWEKGLGVAIEADQERQNQMSEGTHE